MTRKASRGTGWSTPLRLRGLSPVSGSAWSKAEPLAPGSSPARSGAEQLQLAHTPGGPCPRGPRGPPPGPAPPPRGPLREERAPITEERSGRPRGLVKGLRRQCTNSPFAGSQPCTGAVPFSPESEVHKLLAVEATVLGVLWPCGQAPAFLAGTSLPSVTRQPGRGVPVSEPLLYKVMRTPSHVPGSRFLPRPLPDGPHQQGWKAASF